jgi:hypothetical protein
MGRTPEGDQALSGAERQARYRQRLGPAPERPAGRAVPRRPSRARPLSRRWLETVATLVSLQADYTRWLEALPEATRETATGEALQAIADLDLEDLMAIQPPLGFGRD